MDKRVKYIYTWLLYDYGDRYRDIDHRLDAIDKVYKKLMDADIEVFYDDRDVRPGEKLADADLLGIPYRATISPKTKGKIEIKKRNAKKVELISIGELIRRMK